MIYAHSACYKYKHKYSASIALLKLLIGCGHVSLDEFLKNSNKNLTKDQLLKNRKAYHKMIHKLHQEGLVEKIDDRRKSPVKVVSGKLSTLKEKLLKKDLAQHTLRDGGQKSMFPIIVAFDIPEKYRTKRDFLRRLLQSLGYQMIQKSVWIGYYKLSKDFMDELREIRILPYVDVFSINRSGTIRKYQ
ncbi:MAG: CRISPR-associated endonuclease Cas2 [Candidatus Pacebacteria bacterium]|nr:CRISPR-associated endonuclease Cas2 [Candidatus Paceibacterota bacterium]